MEAPRLGELDIFGRLLPRFGGGKETLTTDFATFMSLLLSSGSSTAATVAGSLWPSVRVGRLSVAAEEGKTNDNLDEGNIYD